MVRIGACIPRARITLQDRPSCRIGPLQLRSSDGLYHTDAVHEQGWMVLLARMGPPAPQAALVSSCPFLFPALPSPPGYTGFFYPCSIYACSCPLLFPSVNWPIAVP